MEFFDDTVNTKPSREDLTTQVELITSFFERCDKEQDFFQSMLVDLYRAIVCFRMYNSLDEFMETNPELESCRQDIAELWSEFEQLSQEELAEVALELLVDI